MSGQSTADAEVGLADTIGMLRQPWVQPLRTSAGHGWRGLYLSTQRELPYQASFEPARTHLVVLHLGGPVVVEYSSGGWIERKPVPAGGFFLYPAGRDLNVGLDGDLNTIHANLATEQVDQAAGGRRVELLPRLGPHDPMVEQLLLAMDAVLKVDRPTARTYVDHLTAMLAAHLAHRYNLTGTMALSAPVAAALDQRQLDHVIDVMKLRLAEPIPLADLAAVAGLSTSQLTRRFKTATGLTPHRYLVRLRLAQAVRELRTSDRAIADIATSCGFSHQEHLTRTMRMQTGTTPAEVRRTN
ncbi:helix-turn-helix domain-containing protein [Mycobacterium sp. pUA109]|uniref:AraC family transcriptional regulator n=1 Tax=Mycobacterium sp. pUA109 TaxID=3238982 RepID=UPI00351B9605